MSLPSDRGLSYVTHRIPIEPGAWLEAWHVPSQVPPQGTVLLFHGNGGNKAAQLLPAAEVFHSLGYDAWLVDFRGVGGSSDRTTTLGIREAEDVEISLKYMYKQTVASPSPVVLYGISMGSVAVLKALANNTLEVDAAIVEQPFTTLPTAVRRRIAAAGAPTFPLSDLIVFWGSVQHGFNGFTHRPINDASQVNIPTLVLQGEQDPWTTVEETNRIFDNLQGYKQLTTFPTAGHELLLSIDREKWVVAVEQFLDAVE